jgi:hypothetical protein
MPTYGAFFFACGRFFESDPLTVPEFRDFARIAGITVKGISEEPAHTNSISK